MSIQDKLAAIEARLGKIRDKLTDEKIELLYINLDIVAQFKDDVCSKSKQIDSSEEQDWFSLSLGFFIAKGVTGTTFPDEDPDIEEDDEDEYVQEEFLDAHILAVTVRYNYHYWP